MKFTALSIATPERKIVEARFRDVVLNDPADADEWARRTGVELARFGGPVDLLIDLEGLRVRPAASRRFGEVRANILAKYARHSVRYGPDAWTATSVNTSRVLQGAEANIFGSREEALDALLEMRSRDA
jgi:hypothetical protein